ncbi:TDG/mug DNA glycosylase family protein [Friedmanniella endophytica]|uniref:TDG/mug DNA glycosylase family protein n=1 Tax=Microlunatus kandeliicorticis TaxID=1759536 RepID=A0A7W3IT39_9ACTN|nr:uracil-DNA glycosylase family protein [Microlunatus kandeliicorticis]MBA8794768.1 TDG/mug DNA glycosylase family protein [Microlunatus kandeliicorticis]
MSPSASGSRSTEPDRSLLRPGLRLVIAGTVGRGRRPDRYYAGVGNRFYELLHGSGLVPELLDPDRVERLPELGVSLTDLVLERVQRAGQEPEAVIHLQPFDRAIRAAAPRAVAFVSKTAAIWYARGARERLPKDYGELDWTVAGVPGFVLPGPSGANNGMPLALRMALWTDLADFLDHLEARRPG